MCMSNYRGARERAVCVFDSGIGGLGLLAACAKACPHTSFIYFADNYNVPYGGRPAEKIKSLALSAFERIAAIEPAAAVVACNTVTAVCIDELRKKYSFPVVGIQPAVKQAVAAVPGECLVLATPATVKSRSFADLCERWGQGRVRAAGCEGLAAYIESHICDYPDIDVSPLLPAASPCSVVLGCTHYAFAAKCIAGTYSVPVFDGILGTADHLRTLLEKEQNICLNNQKIEFLGGDFLKNAKIYSSLFGDYNK